MPKKRVRNKVYLIQVVEDIKKQKDSSPYKPSSKRKQSGPKSSTKPRVVLSEEESLPKDKEKVKCLHQLYISYKPETDRRYCKKGMDLDGVKCSKCHVKFGMPRQPPSNTQPIWISSQTRADQLILVFCGY